MRKYLSNVHKMEGAHFQCVKNHYAKFENKDIEMSLLQITQTGHHLSISERKNV